MQIALLSLLLSGFFSDLDQQLKYNQNYVPIFGHQVMIININSGGIPLITATDVGLAGNEDFFILPYFAQEALVAHEIGHFELGHIGSEEKYSRDMYMAVFDTVSPRERDADLFAADLVGQDLFVDMLSYCYNVCKENNRYWCVEEIEFRILMLTKKQCI